MNQNFICVACDSCYIIVNILSSNIQTLFSYNIEQLSPFIANFSDGEFLLNCQGDLGMFATFDGHTTRPPVTWCSNTTRFQISAPYVLCLRNDSSINVYNLNDSKLKQEIKNLGNVKLMKFIKEEKYLLVATSTQILALNSLSLSLQIEQLMSRKQIDEALSLFESSSSSLSKEDYDQVSFS